MIFVILGVVAAASAVFLVGRTGSTHTIGFGRRLTRRQWSAVPGGKRRDFFGDRRPVEPSETPRASAATAWVGEATTGIEPV